MRRSLLLLAAACACGGLSPVHEQLVELKTDYIAQQSPSWCWAATASMALKTLGFPDINSGKDYQCGVVAVAFPECDDDCTKCDRPLETMTSFVGLLNRYRQVALKGKSTGRHQSFSPTYVAYPELGQIEHSLDRSYPVIAGISYRKRPSNPAAPEHAVLITGYAANYEGTGQPFVVLRDPYPYSSDANPWTKAGVPYRQSAGRVEVPWKVLEDQMNLTSAVFLEKVSA